MVCASCGLGQTNVPPTVMVQSAVQRPGTTYMDIDFRVDDPDDSTVEVSALGFINGGSSLSDIVRINTLVEGTDKNVGPSVPANTPLRLTWNAAADWNTNFGKVEVEILAKDRRGLLPFHWITLPKTGPYEEVTINRWPVSNSDLFPLFYWLIATGDPDIQLVEGKVVGVHPEYAGQLLAQGTGITQDGRDFVLQKLNIRSIWPSELARAQAGRYGFQGVDITSVARGWETNVDRVFKWGANRSRQLNMPRFVRNVTGVAVGGAGEEGFTLLLSEGHVACFDRIPGVTTVGLTNVVAIAAGRMHGLALKNDGTVVGLGDNRYPQCRPPAGLNDAIAIAAGGEHSLALKRDGTVVAWGDNRSGQCNVPASVSNVVAIAAGNDHSLALKAEGTVVGWGSSAGRAPSDLTNVVAIAAGWNHSLALKGDGIIVAWGSNSRGQCSVPAGLTNVVAISAGADHSMAIAADGGLIVWGDNTYGQCNVHPGLASIDLLSIGCTANHVVVVDRRTP